ncbi:MAG: hypothetical protein LBL15_08075 [Oscillospiraceae bacterium]|jgi:hypothetical protein|nr:hypothetical protein [Oscillospiraceae bacterium]
MKRRIISAVLAVLLVFPVTLPARADSSGICFTATNDTLLELSSMIAYVGGLAYAPAGAFSAFGINMSQLETKTIIVLHTAAKQIFFDLSAGTCYDSYENYYSASATLRNGQVYVPVAWMCDHFGLYCTTIGGIGYGDIIRIKNGGEMLSDARFLEAAGNLMKTRYNAYFGQTDTAPPASSDGGQAKNPQTPGGSVSLCFVGLPGDTLLDSLDGYNMKACFFLTADETAAAPDTVRRLAGSGHSVGIYCERAPESECKAAAGLIFEAAQLRPTLFCSAEPLTRNAGDYAEANGYAYFTPSVEISPDTQYAAALTSRLQDAPAYLSVLITANGNAEGFMPGVLQYIAKNRITVLPLRETYV